MARESLLRWRDAAREKEGGTTIRFRRLRLARRRRQSSSRRRPDSPTGPRHVGGQMAAAATREAAEEKEDDKKALPPLAVLVKRLAPEVRETLDDLFRAKFTGVRRVPKKFLKTAGG